MKTPLILFAATMISGAAFAQMQPAPPTAMAPGDPAPPPAAPPMAPMTPGAADPAPMAPPSPPMASPAPMASGAPMPPAQQPMGAMPMGASADTSSYPVCSRTVQDKCRNRGGR